MTTLAIDIGGTKLAAALIDNNLRISQRRELPTPASKTPDALREALKALVEPLRAEASGSDSFYRDHSGRDAAGAKPP